MNGSPCFSEVRKVELGLWQASGLMQWCEGGLCLISACLQEGIIGLFIPCNLSSSLVPSLWVIKVQGRISKEAHSALYLWVKSSPELDDYSFTVEYSEMSISSWKWSM